MTDTMPRNDVNFYQICYHFVCYLTVLILTLHHVGCEDTLNADETCKSPPGLDLTTLKAGIWSFRAPPGSQCMGLKSNDSKANCTISMSVCKPLPDDWCGNDTTQSSLCVRTYNGSGKTQTKSYPAGEFVPQPFEQTLSISGGFIANFGDTEYISPNGDKCNVTSQAIFSCNRGAIWAASTAGSNNTVPSIAEPTFKFVGPSKAAGSKCHLYLTFEYDGACIAISPAEKIATLSAGTVLIIIFFVSLAVYFIVGSVFNYFRGYRGKEVIPQSEFWTELPIYIADGILFTCRCGRPENQSAYDSI